MLVKRILSALVGIPLLIFIVFKGGIYLLLAVFLLMLLGLLEFRKIIKKSHGKALTILLWLGAFLFPLAFLINYQFIIALLFFYLLFSYFCYLIYYPKYSPLDLSFTLLGVIYVCWGFFHLILLRELDTGFWLVMYVFIMVWSTDSGAYFTGIYLGKHKLAPLISPKKTWEGFWGGLITSVITAYIFTISLPASVNPGKILLYISPAVSIAGQLGDLFESSLKRFAQIKDSGKIIPGHGGILDRFDSALWAAPVTYYLYIIFREVVMR